MKIRLTFVFVFATFFLSVGEVNAQKFWKKLEKTNSSLQRKEIYKNKNFPSKYKLLSLNINELKTDLKKKQEIIVLPNEKGELLRFSIKETSNFESDLSAKFPTIKSYSAQGIDDPTSVAKISVGIDGFHAVVYSGNEKTIYIDPYSKDNKDYIVYKRSNLGKDEKDFSCKVEEVVSKNLQPENLARNANDGKLRTFRFAIVCSAEYAQFHLKRQGTSDTATDAEKKAVVLSAMNTSLTRINGIYERDLSVKMVLVANNDEVIFLDAATDGITDGDPETMIDEVQTICDTKIGNANYDIGHIFSIGGDGLAGGGVVCVTGQKAKGVTGRSEPIGDAYDVDFVAHEIGHQFGANHTQNNNCNRNNATAVEPGSASTIMGYAGICSPNVQNQSDDYFHTVSITEMWNTIQSSANCATLTDTSNSAPIANAGSDYNIPKSTPFVLKGMATDVDGTSSLTYNWEQIDNGVASMPPLSTNTGGPLFRSLPSKTSPNRYLPELATIVAGSTATTWEVLPSVARDMSFSFLVRDNNAGGGSTARDDMEITVTDAEAFVVSTPNSAVTWDTGSTQTITWNKGTTDVAPINCQNVNIKLSIDGGLTFPITIKSNTPNDGTEDVVIPNNATTTARIIIEAADNIFYNVNSTNFTINSTVPTFLMSNTSGVQSACNSGNQTVSYVLNFDFLNGFSEPVTFTTTGQPSGATIVFTPNSISGSGDVVMEVSNLDGLTPQNYSINIKGEAVTVNQNIDVELNLTTSTFDVLTLTSPVNGATGVALSEELKWDADSNAVSYDVQVASDNNFTFIISSGNVITNSYFINDLSADTTYYWRVKAKNNCGEGPYSSIFSFTTFTPSYCTSTFTDEANGSEHITNVSFNTINNNSGNDTEDGYEDFTNINTIVERGESHQISVTLDTGGYQDHCYVFIDWNQDYIFDNTTERYDLGGEVDDVATASFNINVPSDAKIGSTRMRVIIEYEDPSDGFGEGACDEDHLTEWGETEDYTIIVIGVDSNSYIIQTTSETCVDQNDGIINVDINQTGLTSQIVVTGPSTNVNQILTSDNYSLSDLEPGDYEVCITAQEINQTQCFEVVIEESEEIALKVAERSAGNYSFNISSGTAPYKVFLNEKLVYVSEENIFEVVLEENGNLEVKTVKDCEGSFKTSIGNIYLKQNPVVDAVELVLPFNLGERFVNAMVFDMNGKLIFNKSIKKENNNLSIPFSYVAKGVYILKLSIENSKPIKIIKQ
ncbi:zinc-dependent metalloprotease family protein [Polaribacter sp. Hel1_85]|uniref:zinc-dependent metalloprotease family protein n=1 Tax=Polaribacter sp. Hel1_85 TaxID=1250005 RepID=UPI00052E31A9|nr:zinc-dependent metalloprotease family protein [Polaribacter sp. Hel1_85]KGL58819.1 peptidase, M12B family [Polaribacter sp. Hel1_85]